MRIFHTFMDGRKSEDSWRFGEGTRDEGGDYYVGTRYVEPSMYTLREVLTRNWMREELMEVSAPGKIHLSPDLEVDEGL